MSLRFRLFACAFALSLSLPLLAHGEDKGESPSSDYYRQTTSGNYLASRFAQSNQDWKRAKEFISRLVTLDPDNKSLNEKAMILAMGSGDYDRAFTRARATLDQEPDNVWALMFVTLESLVHKDFENAKRLMATAKKDSIAGFINPVLDIWIEAENGIIATSLPEDNPLELYHIILAADYMKRVKGLPPTVDKRIATADFEKHVLERIADIFAGAGLKEKSLKIYQDLLSDDPSASKLNEKITRVENGKSIDDLIERKEIKSSAQGMGLAMFEVARILYREYNDESAQIFANMALALDPAMTEAKILLAHIQTRHKRYDDAIYYYTSIDQNDPAYLVVQHQVADLLDEMGRTDDAINLLQKLIKEKDDMESLIQLGDLYRRNDEHDQAIKIYNQAFRDIGKDVSDKYWSLYYARGMAYEQSGKWDKAKTDLQKALTYRPNHAYLLNYLGYSMADRGEDLSKALSMIEKAVSLRPRDGYIVDSLGWAHYMMGEYDKSVKPLEQAVELLPYDPTINDHLGDAYWQVGRKLEARFQWRRALSHAEDEEQKAKIEEKLRIGLPKDMRKKSVQEASSGEFESLNP